MLKHLELSRSDSCLNKAAADEPVFVLRAKDPMAAMTIRHWVTMSGAGAHESTKLTEALKAADEMDAWRSRNVPETVNANVNATMEVGSVLGAGRATRGY